MFSRLLSQIPAFFGLVLRFGIICLVMGLLCFLIGEMMPRKNFDYRVFPYACHGWERNGDIYLKLGINRWKDKVPDMSRYIPHTFRKKIGVMRSPEHVEGLIRETCVAELIHWLLWLISPVLLLVMKKPWSIVMTVLYGLSNLPFILIQRYNRPRLLRLYERVAQREQLKKTIEEALPQ